MVKFVRNCGKHSLSWISDGIPGFLGCCPVKGGGGHFADVQSKVVVDKNVYTTGKIHVAQLGTEDK
jgi:hypothetical protein